MDPDQPFARPSPMTPPGVGSAAAGVPAAVDAAAVDAAAVDAAVVDAAASDQLAGDQVAVGGSELDVLEGLERDLAAVEEAMAGLDAIGTGVDSVPVDGSDAAARVAAVVDSQRFTVSGA